MQMNKNIFITILGMFLASSFSTSSLAGVESLENLFVQYEKACDEKNKKQMVEVFMKMQMSAFNITHPEDDSQKKRTVLNETQEKIVVEFFAYHLPRGHKMKKVAAGCSMVFNQIHELLKEGTNKAHKQKKEDPIKDQINEWLGCTDLVYKKDIPENIQKIRKCMVLLGK